MIFSERVLLGLNFTTFLASIFIFLPVCGFLQVLGALSITLNLPKPRKVISSSFNNTSSIRFKKAAAFLSASVLVLNSPFVKYKLINSPVVM